MIQGSTPIGSPPRDCPVMIDASRICDPVIDAILETVADGIDPETIPLGAWLELLNDSGIRQRLRRIEILAFRVGLMPLDWTTEGRSVPNRPMFRTFELRKARRAMLDNSDDQQFRTRIGSVRLSDGSRDIVLPAHALVCGQIPDAGIRRVAVGSVILENVSSTLGHIGMNRISPEEETK